MKHKKITIFKKIIVSGNHLELLKFENGVRIGYKFPNRKQIRRKPKKIEPKQLMMFDKQSFRLIKPEENEKSKEELKPRMSSYIRTKNNIKRLAWSNAQNFCSFLTLTFGDNIKNFDKANYELKNFLKKIRRRYPNIKYLGVCEFQKRGAIHYHLLTNIFHDANELAKIWRNGFIKINKLRNKDNLGNYIVKYLSKEGFLDSRFFNKRKVFYSRNLQKSITIINPYFINDLLRNKYYESLSLTEKYRWNGFNEYIGEMAYILYGVDYKKDKKEDS